jgi:simple sugar transport system permease protein
MKHRNPVPFIFLGLIGLALYFSQMSFGFVLNEVMTRFIRDGLLVLSLLLPIIAGMGINFAIVVGAQAAQAGLLICIIFKIGGAGGLALAAVLGIILAALIGLGIGVCLNRVKGREMIATLVIGLLSNGFYQLIFLVGYGTVIPAYNQEILLSTGNGIRNMVDLAAYRQILDDIWVVQVGNVSIPIFMILLILAACGAMAYLLNTPFGNRVKAIGLDSQKATLLGINVNRTRILVMIISISLAALGQLIYLQNIGMLNVYTSHQNSDIISAAAILAGGATIKQAKVRHVIFGIFLFHALFIVSPQAGQHIFGNAALGEYFRSFIAYGTIAVALILNYRPSNSRVLMPAGKNSEPLKEIEKP